MGLKQKFNDELRPEEKTSILWKRQRASILNFHFSVKLELLIG